MNDIQEIINLNFERDFFFDKGSLKTVKDVEHQIDVFNKKYPNYADQLYATLKEALPNVKIEDWTHFFRQDRSVRFLLEIDEQERYVLQVSIFGFFCVYRRSCVFDGEQYSYGKIEFINQGKHLLTDQLYYCIPNYNEFPWIAEGTLKEIVPSLSILNDDKRYSFCITIADALFSDHYL